MLTYLSEINVKTVWMCEVPRSIRKKHFVIDYLCFSLVKHDFECWPRRKVRHAELELDTRESGGSK
jgi:hypothetical protein